MTVTNTTDNIVLDDLTIKKANISSVEMEPFIQRQNFEAPNPANFLAWNTTVRINANSGMSYSIKLQNVSNQTTWYSPSWTTPGQLEAGLQQALTDITSWI